MNKEQEKIYNLIRKTLYESGLLSQYLAIILASRAVGTWTEHDTKHFGTYGKELFDACLSD